jgi:hypothetical protein
LEKGAIHPRPPDGAFSQVLINVALGKSAFSINGALLNQAVIQVARS